MQRSGIFFGLLSAFVFGAGGVVVKYLLDAGWSPIAAVMARVTVTAVVLAIPGLMALNWDLRPLWRARWTVLLYGTLAVAGVQLAFYSSIQTIPVATTLLIEYLAPVALVALAWVRLRRRPASIVLIGSVIAIAGLALVVGPGGGALDPVGLMFAGIAMIGVAAYYLLGDRTAGIPPLALVSAGFVVGAAELWIVAPTGLLPVEATFGDIPFIWGSVPWWVIVLIVALGATALAYVSGIAAITRLGSRLASFLGLTEVLFAGIIGWILLDQALSPLQIAGGVLILGGIVLIRLEKPAAEQPDVLPVGDLGVAGAPVTGSIPVPRERPDADPVRSEPHRTSPRNA
jgi:drug/metabolite transporter (DMT)-like permease